LPAVEARITPHELLALSWHTHVLDDWGTVVTSGVA